MDTSIEASSTMQKSRIIKKERIKIEHDNKQLLRDIVDARNELNSITRNLNFVNDDMLLDHYIFKLKASEVRYRYLLNKAKELGIEYSEYAEKIQNERYSR